MRMFCFALVVPAGLSISIRSASHAGDDPYADLLINYIAGESPAPAYTEPLTVLGSPERYTGEGVFPGVVSAFNPAFGVDEIVSIGVGGQLTVQFNTPIANDPNNLYGIDLIVFGNTSFIDAAFPNGVVGGLFGNDGGIVQVSDDGSTWHTITGPLADGPMPTMGYVDSGPFDSRPGAILTDFTRPVDPALMSIDLNGYTNQQLVEAYRGAGGGVGIDIGPTGLSEISFVRVLNPQGSTTHIEIDAFSDAAPRLPGDVNLDGMVNVIDLLELIGAWGVTLPGGPPADFDGNGLVNITDLLTVIANWSS
ncbi:MAG: dockerin type I domain-containing protein [Phycisphaerales bacterium]|nr:dockerin type I domain-containing protein [Phycisphaerales bacterium]MCI0674961.1 dockerin type I domain-containing protein [Phycisphaerales bacterium]